MAPLKISQRKAKQCVADGYSNGGVCVMGALGPIDCIRSLDPCMSPPIGRCIVIKRGKRPPYGLGGPTAPTNNNWTAHDTR